MTNPDAHHDPSRDTVMTDELLEEFEDAWQSGDAPDLGRFLVEAGDRTPESSRRRLIELVAIDLEYRWKFHAERRRLPVDETRAEATASSANVPECPRLEDYVAAFPQLGSLADIDADLIVEEYRIRHLYGDRPNHDEFGARFGKNRPDLMGDLTGLDRELQVEGLDRESEPVSGDVQTALSLDDFISRLNDSGLMPADEVRSFLDAESAAPKPKDGAEFARLLVSEKKLTDYQARMILQGEGGQLVLGKHVILDKIGQGGMGVVLKAKHQLMDRVDALKILSPSVIKTPELLMRFHREVQAVARLEHPNIVAAYDADEADGTHFFVMQFVDGTDLLSLVKSRGPLPADEAVNCILQAAQGLQYAHEQGVVHRDIKPSNLMVDQRGALKILDMGLARLESSADPGQTELTGSGQIMGTVDYIAPEQAENTKHADQRADIYSLGITLWYLLTGRAAYEGETVMEKLLAHRGQPIPSLRQACPQASGELESVFAKMIAKTPDTRHQTMTEVIADLERCHSGQTSAPSVGRSAGEGGQLNAVPPDSESAVGLVVATQTAADEIADSSSLERTAALHSEHVDTNPKAQQSPVGPEAGRAAIPTRSASEEKHGDRHPRLGSVWAVSGGGALLLLAAAIVFFVQTKDGVIRVQINDPNIEVSIKGTEIILRQPDQGKDVRLSPGDHTLIVERGDFKFETDKLILKQGETVTVRVELIAGEIQVREGDKLIGQEELPQRPVASETTSASPLVTSPLPANAPNGKLPERLDSVDAEFILPWGPGWEKAKRVPGLITRPARSPGIGRWQLETTLPRSEIASVAWSPDGRLLALGTDTGLVRIYDGSTRRLVRLLVGNAVGVSSVAWRHDGRQLATADRGGNVRVWDVDGTLVRAFRREGGMFYSVAWHPDGKRLAWGGDRGIRISELNGTPGPLLQDHDTPVRSVAWSPDGQQLASAGDDKTVRLWDADGTVRSVLGGHERRVNCVAWSPDGDQLASASDDGRVRLWKEDGTEGPVLVVGKSVSSVAWSSDSEKVAATGLGQICLYRRSGILEQELGTGQTVNCVAWHPQGNWLVTGGTKNRVESCDADGKQQVLIEGHPSEWGFNVAWSPDGETLAATIGERVWQWSRDGKLKRQFKAGGSGAKRPAWHPQGDRIATAHNDKRVRVWGADGKGKPLLVVEGGSPRWSLNGQYLSVNASTAVELWNQDGTKARTFEASPDSAIQAIAWSPDGKWLAAGGEDRKIRLWSQDGKLQRVHEEQEDAIIWLAWSHDSKWLASLRLGGTVRMHKADGTVGALLKCEIRAVHSVAWSLDDKKLALPTGSGITLWETDGTLGPLLLGHTSQIQSLGFSPKTGTLASTGDNIVCIWDGSTGEPQMTIVLLRDGKSATFSAAGQLLDGDPATIEDDFVYIVEQPDRRTELRTRLDVPGQ